MSEKYIGLKDEIRKDPAINAHFGIVTALRWLDKHPDQVPGRTITESEFDRIANEAFDKPFDFHSRLIVAARQLGITVVPDPEPTNAEKLAGHVLRITDDLYIGLTQNDIDKIAKSLDEAGVNALGGGE